MDNDMQLGSRAQQIMDDDIWQELTGAVQEEVFN